MRALLREGVLPQVKNLLISFVISLFLLLFGLNAECLSADAPKEGLNLENMVSKEGVETEFYENPHNDLKCSDCHKKDVNKRTPRSQARLKFKYKVDLCNSCHKGSNLHPIGVDPAKVKPRIKPPRFLPLGKKGKYKGKVICTTCHEIHMEKTDNNLLRGFKGSKASYARLKNHQEFCISCHKKQLAKRSPHGGGEESCIFCHMSDPEIEDQPEVTVRLDIIRRCNFCHMRLEGAHYLAVNAFADKTLKKDIPNLKLPFVGGNITCVTCHDQHFESKIPHKLRPNFVAFAEKSVRINPHWRGTFCLSCHLTVPKRGEEPNYPFEGDINKTCNRCHETEEATADIHPVGMVVVDSDAIKIPEEFKLFNGVLTCATCHDLTTQTVIDEEEMRKNPLFLRGGPYEYRTDICFRCHIQDAYTPQSPHDGQLDENGEIVDAKCLFCHSSRPDIRVVGIRPKMFKGDASTFCYGCHAGKEERHPVNVTHQGVIPSQERRKCIKKTERAFKGMKLPLYDDALFCGTCHNPHQRGVLKGTAQSGAGKTFKLRLPPGYEMCIACHCDKGDFR